MGGQWLRRRGEKEQKGVGDDSLERIVSGRHRGREAKRGFWRASDVKLKALAVPGKGPMSKAAPRCKRDKRKYKNACNTPASKFVDRIEREKQNG